MVKLLVAHHAFMRVADWHEEYRDLCPSGKITLNPEQAQRVMRMLEAFVRGMERGRPSTMLQRLNEDKERKYGRPSHYIYERSSADLYSFIAQGDQAVLVTVTNIVKKLHRIRIMDDPISGFRFSAVTQIGLPYCLNRQASNLDIFRVRKPSGGTIPVVYSMVANIQETWGLDQTEKIRPVGHLDFLRAPEQRDQVLFPVAHQRGEK